MFRILPPILTAQRNIVSGRLSVDLWPISDLFKNLKLNMGEAQSIDEVTVVGSYAELEYGPV